MTGQPVPDATRDAKAWHDSGLAFQFDGHLHVEGGPDVIGDLA